MHFSGKKAGVLRPASGDADGVDDVTDNCVGLYNPAQENTDRDFVDLSAYGRPFNDLTWPASDMTGDACDPDGDNDGFPNSVESSLPGVACPPASAPTQPLARDSDGDQVLDGAECLMGTDPASALSLPSSNPLNDIDRDGLSAPLELWLGSNPIDGDTDDDRIPDGIEFKSFGTSLHVVDSDGDGCSDGIEVASVNMDRVVSSGDQLLVAVSYGLSSNPAYVAPFDISRDGAINSGDLLVLARLFGHC
jgi:hypothetical protein